MEDTQNTPVEVPEQEPNIELTPQESQLQTDQGTERLLLVYDQIAESEDIAYKTAALMTISHYYTFALLKSNEINGRQGKNRLTVSTESGKLMASSFESDIDDILDQQLTDLFVEILNAYLEDKQELPSGKPKIAQGIMGRVKALMIMLTTTNQYGVIPRLNIPSYVLGMVSTLFDTIQQIREEVLNAFIDYLINNGNAEMAEIVKAAGNSFWGSEGVKANVIYEKYFGHLRDTIVKPVETYNAYLKFRSEYRRSTKNILPSKIYEIFEMNADMYSNMRKNVYYEIQELFPDQEKLTKSLIYEN